jgi:MoxR-like ATPase
MDATPLDAAQAQALIVQLKTDLESAVFGQESLITEAMSVMLSGGHILITGAPGLAKTTLVRVLAQLSGLDFGRVQFTPDLLPSDITGTDVLNVDPESGRRNFEFVKGPIFTNLLLADEINRASPRTQSALLEAMQERAITIGGKRYTLAPPFMVFATQNPFESEGTFVLPEAQLDRFLLHSLVDYPQPDAERKVYSEHVQSRLVGETDTNRLGNTQVIGSNTMLSLIQSAKNVRVPDELIDVVRDLVRATRPQDELCPEQLRRAIWFGAGTRAGLALISVARSFAFINAQEAVRWEHIKRMVKPVLRHRIKLTAQALRDQQTPDRVIDLIVERVEARYGSLMGSAR